MSGQSFPQDVVAGTQLVVPAIHSPNYLTGSTGWTINLDGSAEFNNLTIRGTFSGTNFIVNSSGAFFYSPTEAHGNLIVSIASAAGTDAFGNAYPKGINVTTGTIAGTTISGTNISGSTFTGTDFVLNDDGAFFYNGTPAAGNLIASISNFIGTDSFGNDYYDGFTSYDTDIGSVVQVADGALSAGLNSAFLGTGGALPGTIDCNSTNGEMDIVSGLTDSTDTGAALIVASANTGTSSGSAQISLFSDAILLGNGAFDTIPFPNPGGFPLPNDPNSGTGWVSGERAFMNNSWIAPINALYTVLVEAGIIAP